MTSPVSFAALRALVEVGRQGGIKRAALVLNVTAGAVSQHIRGLEARFGVPLLIRGHRMVRLSSPGQRLYDQIAPGFTAIEASVALFDRRQPQAATLTISTTPSFAACWLAPRLGAFTAAHPAIELRVETSVALADLAHGPVDVAIRHGDGNYLGLETTVLYAPSLIVVGSPTLLDGRMPMTAAECLRFPLLQDRDRADWPFWLAAQGVVPGRTATRGPSYADDALLIQAAIAGQGLAVVRDLYAAGARAAGQLHSTHGTAVPTVERYFTVTRTKEAKTARAAAFCAWIASQMSPKNS